jgi:tight adherence protein C
VPLPLLFGLLGTFVAVALASGTAAFLVLEFRTPARVRLQATAVTRRSTSVLSGGALLIDAPNKLVTRLASFVPKSAREMTRLQRRLVRAGYHSLTSAVVVSVAEVIVPVVLSSIILIFVGWQQGWPYALGAAAVGFMLPSLALARVIEKRRKAISNGLADALDLLIVCLRAGSSLDQSIAKATEELTLSYPALAEELKMLSTETRAGKPRIEAFKNLETRTKNDDVRALVTMLIQTDRFGTSVSQALATLSEVSRTKRRQRAEESAAKIGVKLVFPLVLCLFPALFVATAGAAIVQIVRIFS